MIFYGFVNIIIKQCNFLNCLCIIKYINDNIMIIIYMSIQIKKKNWQNIFENWTIYQI